MIISSRYPSATGAIIGALIGAGVWLFLPEQFFWRVGSTAAAGAILGLFVTAGRRVY